MGFFFYDEDLLYQQNQFLLFYYGNRETYRFVIWLHHYLASLHVDNALLSKKFKLDREFFYSFW